MNLPVPRRARGAAGRQRGVAAVELALLLPIMLVFLAFPLFFARYFWHYTVAQKAAQDAARYLSTISVQEMKTASLAQSAVAIASQIATTEMAELNPGSAPPSVAFVCGADPSTGTGARPLPATVRVHVAMDMFDNIFGMVDTGRYGWPITVDVEMRYAPQ
jgi:Flp pilus assembly protein TadG